MNRLSYRKANSEVGGCPFCRRTTLQEIAVTRLPGVSLLSRRPRRETRVRIVCTDCGSFRDQPLEIDPRYVPSAAS